MLAESRLERRGQHYSSSLRVRRRSNPEQSEIISLPVLPDGRINELVRLPDDVAELTWQPPKNGQPGKPELSLRPVGWLERVVRMADRVVRTYARLSGHQRLESGLTFWRAFYDLPGAYRAATAFRVRYPVLEYAEWTQRFDTLEEKDVARIQAHIARFAEHPHFHLLLMADTKNQDAIGTTIASLRGQLYRNFTCILLDCAGSLDAAFPADTEMKNVGLGTRVVRQPDITTWLTEFNASLTVGRSGKWVMVLRAGDTLPAHALYWFACELQARADVSIVYSDDDAIDAQGRRQHPRFKPDWSPAHLHSTHYVGSAAVLRGSDVAKVGGVTLDCCRHGNYDLLLRLSDIAGERVAHVPAVLYHRGAVTHGGDAWEDPQWCAGMTLAHLARKGVTAEVVQTQPACRRIRYRLPGAQPLVSIIVPTRNKLELLRNCMDSVLEKTTYPRFEILLVDNQTSETETLAYLEEIARHPLIRVLRQNQPFNYSAINNLAAREARGDVLCLLNNDTQVISPDWLEEMTGHLWQEKVGAVGAKLYYPDGRVQHAGVAVGPGGCADHLHLGLERHNAGYCHRAVVAHEISAVTGACMVTWKHLYERLGGLNEEKLIVAFNDVDYCLRLQEAGYRVIITPHAELLHHESATRGRDLGFRKRMRANREIKYMRSRWADCMRHDPYYNPNLSYRRPDFSLSETPRVKKPWAA